MRGRYMRINFNPSPEPVCELCGKRKHDHKAQTFNCPVGLRGRANTYSFSESQMFIEKPAKVSRKFQVAIETLRETPDSHLHRLRVYQLIAELEEENAKLKREINHEQHAPR